MSENLSWETVRYTYFLKYFCDLCRVKKNNKHLKFSHVVSLGHSCDWGGSASARFAEYGSKWGIYRIWCSTLQSTDRSSCLSNTIKQEHFQSGSTFFGVIKCNGFAQPLRSHIDQSRGSTVKPLPIPAIIFREWIVLCWYSLENKEKRKLLLRYSFYTWRYFCYLSRN